MKFTQFLNNPYEKMIEWIIAFTIENPYYLYFLFIDN